MKKYTIYQVDAFTQECFRGNPAGVVPRADGLTETEMKLIARELNNSETAFVFNEATADYDVHVRFFTPSGIEVPVCGHATIATHYVRAIEQQLPACTVVQKTGAGLLPVDIILSDQDYQIVMTQGKITYEPPFAEAVRQDIIRALGLIDAECDSCCPLQIFSTGHSKVMIGIQRADTLHCLSPDLARLAQLSATIGCNGYFVFTLQDLANGITHGRMFAPAIGINEDPVTGNANGPLGAYLVHHKLVEVTGNTFEFTAMQGEAIGRVGQMRVSVLVDSERLPKTVKISGYATTVFKTEIYLQH